MDKIGSAKENYVAAMHGLVQFEKNEAYVMACQKQSRKDVYRKWFLAGHLPKDNPKYADEDGQIAKAAQLAFIGPVAPIEPDPASIRYHFTDRQDHRMYTADWESITTRNERKRLEEAVEAAQQAYNATPEGQADLHYWAVLIWVHVVLQQNERHEQESLYTRCLRQAPHRLYFTPEQARFILADQQLRQRQTRWMRRKPRLLDWFDSMPGTLTRIHSDIEGRYWWARQHIADYKYLDFIEIAQACTDERKALYIAAKAQMDADLAKFGEATSAREPEETWATLTFSQFRKLQRAAVKEALPKPKRKRQQKVTK